MAINKVNPTAIRKVVSVSDEAIDQKAMGKNWEKYQENYDFKLLKFKENMFPTIFLVKNLLATEEAQIKQEHFRITFPELANKNADELQSMKMNDVKPTIKQVKIQEMMIKYFDFGVTHYEEEGKQFECNANVFPLHIVQELGAFIMTRTQLGDNLKND